MSTTEDGLDGCIIIIIIIIVVVVSWGGVRNPVLNILNIIFGPLCCHW